MFASDDAQHTTHTLLSLACARVSTTHRHTDTAAVRSTWANSNFLISEIRASTAARLQSACAASLRPMTYRNGPLPLRCSQPLVLLLFWSTASIISTDTYAWSAVSNILLLSLCTTRIVALTPIFRHCRGYTMLHAGGSNDDDAQVRGIVEPKLMPKTSYIIATEDPLDRVMTMTPMSSLRLMDDDAAPSMSR